MEFLTVQKTLQKLSISEYKSEIHILREGFSILVRRYEYEKASTAFNAVSTQKTPV